jgi:predicted GIY-YIG superfamily endonuclease
MGRVDYEKDRSKISEGDNQYLYVFGNPATQRIKIGVTNDILRRFKELQTAGGSYLSNIIYIKVIVGCDE